MHLPQLTNYFCCILYYKPNSIFTNSIGRSEDSEVAEDSEIILEASPMISEGAGGEVIYISEEDDEVIQEAVSEDDRATEMETHDHSEHL